MAIHDAWPRLTPYELLLPAPDFAERRFPAIADEAEVQGVDPSNPAAFLMLVAAQGVLAELRPNQSDPGSAQDHGVALFFAWQLWRAAPGVCLVRTEVLRELLDGTPDPALAAGGWTTALRERAGYLQLPQHLLWLEEESDAPGSPSGSSPESAQSGASTEAASAAAPSAPPESIDGFFWFADRAGALHLALVAGMRTGRPGFAIVPLPPQPLDALPDWASGPGREDGPDFASSLPGAELEGLAAVRTPAEAFKLAARLLHRLVQRGPGAARSPVPTPASPSDADAASPPSVSPAPSALSFVIL